jgi:hypothetical protein
MFQRITWAIPNKPNNNNNNSKLKRVSQLLNNLLATTGSLTLIGWRAEYPNVILKPQVETEFRYPILRPPVSDSTRVECSKYY